MVAANLQQLLQILVDQRGSDLHVRSGSPAYLRVDGLLRQASPDVFSQPEVEAMLSSVMTPHARALFERERECDFSFQSGEAARFRVNAFRQRQRLCLAIRHISAKIPSIQELGLPVATVRKIADNSRGLVLVTGVTGSGKSSTLASMVDYINESRSEHIITIEDPIEFVHKDKKGIVSQREVGEDTSSFAESLRMAMRQDPDVIMVGEMRDLETTSAALTAAQTGHLVLGTLHTVDAIQTITRIVDLYAPHQQPVMRVQLAETLKAVVSQRLLPCSKGGRVPAVEILIVTAHVRKCIEENKSSEIVQACAKGQFYGMQTFNQALVKLFKEGLVSEADILEAASSPDDVRLALRGIEPELKAG
ncbi:MAG: type IV pilus twitching motility protein PilT [Elusimicrobia bacterium]|nr:type IV pilus twitching motility protein PilT [Elusimicrobiota bacterium]MDE2236824.1 type IV pilus twitching motility protein PilT [Elusimicrobiota bacterium]MDE2425831.1 type IV pilus twitching motility protein PilT [Elusimicrobiota bacterium]